MREIPFLLPAMLTGKFPHSETRSADRRDSLLIELLDQNDQPDPWFGAIAVRPSAQGVKGELALLAFVPPCPAGGSYKLTLFRPGAAKVVLGRFRFLPGTAYDVLNAAITQADARALRLEPKPRPVKPEAAPAISGPTSTPSAAVPVPAA